MSNNFCELHVSVETVSLTQCYQQISAVVLFPGVDVDSVTGKVYWVNSAGEFPFLGMNSDGCSFTTCPVVAGNMHSYVYQLSISKKFPVVSGGVRL